MIIQTKERERGRLGDLLVAARDIRGVTSEELVAAGAGIWELFGPDGELRERGLFYNLITDVGDEVIAKRYRSASVNVPTGMRLGTGSTGVAKNGAGAAIVTYVAGSAKAIDGGFPTDATKGAGLGHRVVWKTSWAAGEATANGIAEVVLTNETPLTSVAGTAANTLARALLSPTVNKGANDTLAVTWNHDVLGA